MKNMILSYETLAKFKQARFGNNIITFDDLIKERSFDELEVLDNDIWKKSDKQYHCWIARKDKKEYLINHLEVKQLPLKINETLVTKENKAIYHFVRSSEKVGFTPTRYYSFKEMVDILSESQHSNKAHQKLMWCIALCAYLQKINVRICSNIEFGKDSTFLTLGYLTGRQISVFDKPKTLAKLEFGLLNNVLMVNELVPSKEEERRDIAEFLLSVGSLSPIYHKKTRSGQGTQETYDMNDFSLVICYNTLQEIAENDKQNYFDFVFGQNILKRYLPLKLTGKLNIKQFKNEVYTQDTDLDLLKLARTIEWYKHNFKQEIKPYSINLQGLSDRQQLTLQRIADVLSLYAPDETNFKIYFDELVNSYMAYDRMLKGNSRVSDYIPVPSTITNNNIVKEVYIEPEIIDLSTTDPKRGYPDFKRVAPMEFMKLHNGEVTIDVFMENYTQEELNTLLKRGDIFQPNTRLIKLLQ